MPTAQEVVRALADIGAVAAEYEQAAKRFAATHTGANDGRAATRVVDWLVSEGR